MAGREPRRVAAAARSAPLYHSVCGPDDGRLTPSDTVRLHEATVRWLDAALASSDPARTAVVSHHAPSPQSLRAGWYRDLMMEALTALGTIMRDRGAGMRARPAVWLMTLLIASACAQNPVTGERDFVLMSEAQENAWARVATRH